MIFDALFERRASLENPSTSLSDPAMWLTEALGGGPSTAGVVVSEKNAIQVVAFWSAVNTISDTLGELPLSLIRSKEDGSTEVVNRHTALRVLRNPNSMMTPISFRAVSQKNTLVSGNSYAYIVRNSLGNAVELWPLDPSNTRPIVVNKKLYFDTVLDIGNTRLSSEDVLHIPAITTNGVNGISVVAAQREMLGSAIAQQNFAGRFFSNGAKPSGLISYPGKVRDPDKVKVALQRNTGGENAHSIMVLDNDAKFTPFSIPPEDAQFLQTREFSVDEIGRMFRLPLHFLNKMGQATFNNLEMMGTHFVQYTMVPWIVRHEQEYTRKLLKPGEIDRGLKFKFNVAALIRGDIKSRSEVYAKAVQFGWMTRNEVRSKEDMNPLEGLDDPLIPMNLSVVGDEPEPAPENVPPPDDDSDDDDSDESSSIDDRGYLVLVAAATRLANKESIAVSRILNKQDGGHNVSERLQKFYDGHIPHLIENLAIAPDDARQYGEFRIKQLRTAENFDEILLAMTTSDVAQMVNAITEERA